MIPNKRRIKFLIRIEAKYLKVLSSKSTVLEEGPGMDIKDYFSSSYYFYVLS